MRSATTPKRGTISLRSFPRRSREIFPKVRDVSRVAEIPDGSKAICRRESCLSRHAIDLRRASLSLSLSLDLSSTDRRRLKSFGLTKQVGNTNTRDAIVHSLKPRRVNAKLRQMPTFVDRLGEFKGTSTFEEEKCRVAEEPRANR